MESRSTSRLAAAAMAIALSIVLTACGGGNDESEPTATTAPSDAQPTVETTAASTPDLTTPEATPPLNAAPPPNTDMSSPGVAPTVSSTPETNTATPDAAGDESPNGTGDTVAIPATPASPSSESTGASAAATPASGTDGTSGAAPQATASPATPAAPATPVSGATPAPAATPRASAEVPVVTGCDVTDVPPFKGEISTYVLSVDLNFRAGPGSDCDLIGDGPLGEFSVVEVIGGPVEREGDESGEWVQVQVGEQVGWLALEYLEPAE